MTKINADVTYLTGKIVARANPEKAAWWNNYLKDSIRFIGVGIPDIRKILLDWHKTGAGNPDYRTTANQLLRQESAEFKLAGILIYQLFLLGKVANTVILNDIEELFAGGYIFDWNTCDWLCVRVLTPIVNDFSAAEIQRIKGWSRHENYWQARAALIPFAQSSVLKDHYRNLEIEMRVVIKRKERFAKTAVGWLLREISRFDMPFVRRFLRTNQTDLSKEVTLNALKYLEKADRKAFISQLNFTGNARS